MQLAWGPPKSPQFMVLQMDNKNHSIALGLIKVDIIVPTEDFPDAKGE